MKITVIGFGYISLPTAMVLTHSRQETIGYDINKTSKERISRGEILIGVPGLRH